MIRFLRTPLEPEILQKDLGSPLAGGIVIFEGRVRNHHNGKGVLFLEYEAYVEMAEEEMKSIVREIRERFDILEIVSVHRLGRVEIGEVAVWIGVAAVHRGPAFQACSFAIDALKHRLPIWKKEFYSDGQALWVDCRTHVSEEIL
ncbi:MAG: molybdenum cofactor biosynthesis protein MoaE [Leptospirales bacterium]